MIMSDMNRKVKERIVDALSADSPKERGIPNPCLIILLGEPGMPEELIMDEVE